MAYTGHHTGGGNESSSTSGSDSQSERDMPRGKMPASAIAISTKKRRGKRYYEGVTKMGLRCGGIPEESVFESAREVLRNWSCSNLWRKEGGSIGRESKNEIPERGKGGYAERRKRKDGSILYLLKRKACMG